MNLILMLLFILACFLGQPVQAEDITTQLMDAACAGELDKVKALIKSGAKINYKDRDGFTPLMMAVHGKGYPIILDRMERDSERDRADQTNSEVLKFLIEKGAKIDEKDKDGRTALFMTPKRGGLRKIATALLDGGSNINQKDKDGYTTLIVAAKTGDEEFVRMLINRGAEIEAKTSKGDTALSEATFFGRTDIIKLLGGEPKPSNTGQTIKEIPDYTIFEREAEESPLKAQAELAVIVTEPTNEEALRRLIYKLYDDVSQTKFNRFNHPTHCGIWIYLSKDQADSNQYIMFLRKKPSDRTPVLLKNDSQIEFLNTPPVVRFGLSEPERIKIWKETIKIERIVTEKTNDSSRREKMTEEYNRRLARKFVLSVGMIHEIENEGVRKNWPLPED